MSETCKNCGKPLGNVTYCKTFNELQDNEYEEIWCYECGIDDEDDFQLNRDVKAEMKKFELWHKFRRSNIGKREEKEEPATLDSFFGEQ